MLIQYIDAVYARNVKIVGSKILNIVRSMIFVVIITQKHCSDYVYVKILQVFYEEYIFYMLQ